MVAARYVKAVTICWAIAQMQGCTPEATPRIKKIAEEKKQGGEVVLNAPDVSAPTPLENSIKIEWSPVEGADSYLIYWSSSSGVTGSSETIENAVSPHVHTGLDVKNTYYYRVGAVRGGKYGPLSQEVSASPFDPSQVSSDLLPATLVTATAVPNSATALTISWAGDDRADSYNIYYSNSAGVSKISQVIMGVTSPYQHNALATGAIYYYRVAGVKGGIPGPLSLEISSVVQSQSSGSSDSVTPLPAPSSLTTDSAGAGKLQLTWSDVAGAVSYNIYYNTISQIDTRSSMIISNVTSPYQHTSLTPGVVYYYRVAAVQNNVVGRLSNVQSGVPEPSSSGSGSGPVLAAPAFNPGSPVSGVNSLTLNWSAVAGASKYNLYFSETPGITTTQRFIPLSSGTIFYTHTNRPGGQTYYYRVAAARLVNGITEVGNLSTEVSGAAQKSNAVAPVFSPPAGFYPTTTSIVVGLTSATSGATIYYRTDGQNPDCGGASSTLYSGSFSITSSATIKAMACYRPSFNDSSITTMTYIVNVGSCGSSGSCYADAKLKAEGFAFISGTTQLLQFGPANPSCEGTSCFKIWREYNGNKFLNASGIWKSGASTWQKKLISNGERFKDEYAAFPADTLNFEGLRCPVNSFVYQTAPSVMGQCLYYEFAQQSNLSIADWNLQSSGAGANPSFFEGNPDICSIKGMRIPTIVETSISTKPSNNLHSYSETYSGEEGIPSDSNNPSDQSKYFWTSTAHGSGTNRFWAWSGNSTRGDVSSTVNYVRCVLPSEPVLFCGQTGNSCYDNSIVTAARNAYLWDGQAIEYVPTETRWNSSNFNKFFVWKEKVGVRVLKANGLWNGDNDWQKQLDPPGVNFFAEDFTDFATLAGRSCIPSVFLNRSDMTAENKCLYYDVGSDPQWLNAFPGTIAEQSLENWNDARTGNGAAMSWYEGNINTCAIKGMRLPTLYETTATKPSGNQASTIPIEVGINPIFAGSRGVPHIASSVITWTATGHSSAAGRFFFYSGSSSGPSSAVKPDASTNESAGVRCVLPSSEPNAKITQHPVAVLYSSQPPTFSVQVQRFSDVDLSYQWQKSTDGGLMFTDLVGKTSSSMTVDSVLGSDHRSLFRVAVNVTSTASSLSPLRIYSSSASLFVANRLVTCGESALKGCYGNTQAMSEGLALLTDGTLIELAEASAGFKVWKEYFGQQRVLPASGLWDGSTSWQRKLVRNGEDFSARTDGSQYFTAHQSLAGRVCPTAVFINRMKMTESNRCLYYDTGTSTSQSLVGAQLGVEKEDWISTHNSVFSGAGSSLSWYEGNVKFCADKGMRLPVLYETTATSAPPFVPLDANFTLDGRGVPNLRVGIPSWTASGQQELPNYFIAWNGAAAPVKTSSSSTNDVRCVLP